MIPLVTVLLILALLVGYWRVWHGPTVADRLLAVQMFGTGGIAVLLLLSQWLDKPHLLEVALILALLAGVVAMALVQLLRTTGDDGG